MDSITAKKRILDQARRCDSKLYDHILTSDLLRQAARQARIEWGRGPLHVGTLVWLSLGSAIHTTKSFAQLLLWVFKILDDAPPPPLPPSPPGRRRRQRGQARVTAPVTEEAWVQARRKLPTPFWNILLGLLFDRFEAQYAEHVRWKQFRLLALDGTVIDLPRWQRLRAFFGAAQNSSGAHKTQARLVLLQAPRCHLPWRYMLTPLSMAERTCAKSLLEGLQPCDLILMDRGFWSYGAFWQIQQQQAFFAIRKSSQVRWRVLRRLGRDDYLVRHQPRDGKKQWKGLPPTLDLRYIPYQLAGFRPSGVVTNVLDPAQISREEWVRMAAVDEAGRVLEPGLYHRRWEIETTFRELKVVQGMEGHLRSRSPEGIAYEVGGHLLWYLLLRWLMVEAAVVANLDPLRVSFKGALEEALDMRTSLLHADAEYARSTLLPRLLIRMSQHLVSPRPGRSYPRGRPQHQPKRRRPTHSTSKKKRAAA